jgi:tRNA(Arg) A34 adenosine deaminase TadA
MPSSSERAAARSPRRDFLRRAGLRLLGLAAACGLLPPLHARAAPGRGDIPQPARPGPEAFMRRAFEMRDLASRSGDQPYGAVVVKDGRIVGQGPSRVLTAPDPTAHAEVEALRDAARRLGTNDLSGCVLYASFRPCRMCETAAHWAGVARMYHGEGVADAGQPRYGGC